MKLVYISDSFFNLSVFDSQVHLLCNEKAKEMDVTLLVMCSWRNIFKKFKKDRRYKLKKVFVISRPTNFFHQLSLLFFNQKKELMSCDIIHCRGHLGSYFGLSLLKKYGINKKLIADIRGAMIEEMEGLTPTPPDGVMRYYKKVQDYVFSHSDYFFFVSENMREYYSRSYKDIAEKSSVFPTIVDDSLFFKNSNVRGILRNKLNIKDKYVYIYVGGVDYWQNIDKIIYRFKELSDSSNYFYLILLVSDVEFVKNIALQSGLDLSKVLIDRVEYSSVPDYLNAADAGLIIRDDTIVNYVASPTKVNEYLACGLKIVTRLEDMGNNKIENNKTYKPLLNILKEQNELYLQIINQ